MSHLGDVSRGKALFFNEARLACSRCHSVEQRPQDAKVGPPLFAVGDRFGRRDLIESILTPSSNIAVGYSTTKVRTRSGGVIQGILRESTNSAISLMQSDGTLARVPIADIERQHTTDVSLMPEGLQGGLTTQEFADIVEYLASLKLPETAAAIGHGMPATIPELEKPVALTVFTPERFEHPVWFGPVPGLADTYGVEEHESGKIWFLKHGSGTDEKSLFVDTGHFHTGTRGLVGLVFHPRSLPVTGGITS